LRLAVVLLALGSSVLSAQSTSPGSIQGTVTDAQNKPFAGALVIFTRTFQTPKEEVAPYSQSVKTASDGSFLEQGLPSGSYMYCAQVAGDGYLNGCRWGMPMPSVTLSAGQSSGRSSAWIRVDPQDSCPRPKSRCPSEIPRPKESTDPDGWLGRQRQLLTRP
jgi:hypothetical protein